MVHSGKSIKNMILLLSSVTLLACTTVKEFKSSAASPLIARGAVLGAHTHNISQALLDGLTGGGVSTVGADDLIAQLDAAHVDKAVALSLGYWTLPDDSNMAAENDFTATEVAKYPDRLIGFCGINPRYDSALDEIERSLSHPNTLGIKLQGSAYNWTDPNLMSAISAILKKAGEKDAPSSWM